MKHLENQPLLITGNQTLQHDCCASIWCFYQAPKSHVVLVYRRGVVDSLSLLYTPREKSAKAKLDFLLKNQSQQTTRFLSPALKSSIISPFLHNYPSINLVLLVGSVAETDMRGSRFTQPCPEVSYHALQEINQPTRKWSSWIYFSVYQHSKYVWIQK